MKTKLHNFINKLLSFMQSSLLIVFIRCNMYAKEI